MRRNELITITAASMDCEPEYVGKVIDAFIDTIVTALKTQDWIELRTDFGSFVVCEKGNPPDVCLLHQAVGTSAGTTEFRPQHMIETVQTHTDRKQLHNHIVLNSVNWQTGRKWQAGVIPAALSFRQAMRGIWAICA